MFLDWLDEAITAGVAEPHAMTLSTVDDNGHPDARVLILKDVDGHGWWFATDLLSAKAAELAVNPHAALTFSWAQPGRQVRVRGTATRADDETSAADFASRGPRARAAVLAAQDLTRAGSPWTRGDLAAATDRWQRDLTPASGSRPGGEPAPWAAYALAPTEVEFWQADPGRLHHRIRSTHHGDRWQLTVLPH